MSTVQSETAEPVSLGTGERMLARLRRSGLFVTGAALLTIIVCVAILLPLVKVIGQTFIQNGALNAAPLQAAFALPQLVTIIWNTIVVVLVSVVFAVSIATFLAWLTERTDLGMEWLTRILPIVPLFVPPIAGAIGWVLLAAPKAGFINVGLRALLGLAGIAPEQGPLNIFSWYGLIFVYVLCLVPEIYLTVAAGLRNVDPALEEAGRICGSGVGTTFRRITLPSIKPSIIAGCTLALLTAFALFSVPVIIGPQAGLHLLSVRVVELVTASYPPKIGEALVLGLLVAIVCGSAWLVEKRILRTRLYSVIGGKTARVAAVRLGRWRPILQTGVLLFLALTTLLPLAALLIVSLQPFWSPIVDFATFSTRHYSRLLSSAYSYNALFNSITLGLAGATIGTGLAAIMAVYFDRNRNNRFARVLDGITKLPGAVSHLIVGIAFVGAFAGPPFNLNGTMGLILLAYLVIFMPQATLNATAAMAQVGGEMSEASAMSGASPGTTFIRILLPLMLPGLAASWALLFVLMAGEITASSMLASSRNPVVGFVVLDLWQNGSYSGLAALGVLVSLMNGCIVSAMLYFTRRQ